MKFYRICRVRCKCCGDVLEHVNRTKTDSHPRMFYCSCGKVALDPAAIGYRIIGNLADFEDLSEEWEEAMDLNVYGVDFPIDDILRKDIEAFIQAKESGKELLDCEAAEIDGDIRACLNAGALTRQQADFLYKNFVFNW